MSNVTHTKIADMTQIKIRWGDLGSPTQPGNYRYGRDMVSVLLEDIELAKGDPDAVFTAIHPDFYSDEAPYLLTQLEFPGQVSRIPCAQRQEAQMPAFLDLSKLNRSKRRLG